MDNEQQILCLAARTHLDPATEQQLLERFAGPVDWERLWTQGHRHEVLPLLAKTLRHLDGKMQLATTWQARAQRRFYATMMRNTVLADAMVELLAGLRQAGVDAIPVKGIVLAELYYGGLGLRSLGDLDILVRPADLAAARTVLRRHGYFQPPEPGFDNAYHSFHDPPYYRDSAAGQVCVELHWGLWASRFFRLAPDSLWERSRCGRVHGRQARLLSNEDTLLHLAIHRSRSALRLRFVCDIAELLRRHGPELDWEYIVRQAEAAGARTALYFALALASELLDAPLPDAILARLGVGRMKRYLLEKTCGVAALFRPADEHDLSQQPSLILRVLEQDGFAHVAWTLGTSLARKGQKRLYQYGLLRRSSE